jgi:hypothetical protein
MPEDVTSDGNGPMEPDLGSVFELVHGRGLPDATEAFKQAHLRARRYLLSFGWVSEIEQEYLGTCIDNIIYIFLFKIRPTRDGAESWFWVVVGDLPSAYLNFEGGKTPFDALCGYLAEMQAWVEAARKGESVAELIPVNVPPTPKYVDMLAHRLEFLARRILPMLRTSDKPGGESTGGHPVSKQIP